MTTIYQTSMSVLGSAVNLETACLQFLTGESDWDWPAMEEVGYPTIGQVADWLGLTPKKARELLGSMEECVLIQLVERRTCTLVLLTPQGYQEATNSRTHVIPCDTGEG